MWENLSQCSAVRLTYNVIEWASQVVISSLPNAWRRHEQMFMSKSIGCNLCICQPNLDCAEIQVWLGLLIKNQMKNQMKNQKKNQMKNWLPKSQNGLIQYQNLASEFYFSSQQNLTWYLIAKFSKYRQPKCQKGAI